MPNVYSLRFSSFVEKLLNKKPGDWPTSKEALAMIPTFIKTAYSEKNDKNFQEKEGNLNPKFDK